MCGPTNLRQGCRWSHTCLGGFDARKDDSALPYTFPTRKLPHISRLWFWLVLYKLPGPTPANYRQKLPNIFQFFSGEGKWGRTKYRRIPTCEGDKQGRVQRCSLPWKTLLNKGFGAPIVWGISPKLFAALRGIHPYFSRNTRTSPWPIFGPVFHFGVPLVCTEQGSGGPKRGHLKGVHLKMGFRSEVRTWKWDFALQFALETSILTALFKETPQWKHRLDRQGAV